MEIGRISPASVPRGREWMRSSALLIFPVPHFPHLLNGDTKFSPDKSVVKTKRQENIVARSERSKDDGHCCGGSKACTVVQGVGSRARRPRSQPGSYSRFPVPQFPSVYNRGDDNCITKLLLNE